MKKRIPCAAIFLITFFILVVLPVQSQTVYHDASNRAIYEFLDELSNEGIIQTSTVVKPYSRRFIAEKLQEAEKHTSQLNTRQIKELHFYLRDFGKEVYGGKFEHKRFDVLYYNDSVFTFSLNGILGAQFWNNENGFNYHRWYGGEVFAYAGKTLGVYASLRDNTEKLVISDTGMITTRPGGKYRSGDYSEMRGGITLSWKWGTVGLVKDRMEWGTSYNYPNIISTKAPSFAHLKLHLYPAKWFEFNYIHGWLVSEVVDSSRSYNYNGVQRDVFHGKYMAANLFTFKPWQKINFSLGNSVIYSDIGVHPAYLIPVFFYKSVDHSYNGNTNEAGQNSQMFFDISFRMVPKLHLYYTMFVDVLSFGSVFDSETHANHWSMQGGFRLTNLLPNTVFTAEYTRTNPLTYKNDVTTTLYNSNWYNMGHYLNDNARGIYLSSDYKFSARLQAKAWFVLHQKGPDYPYIREAGEVLGVPYMESVEWQQQLLGIRLSTQLMNDFFAFAQAEVQNTSGNSDQYLAPYFRGNLLNLSVGLNFGFY
ncbi:MAG: hypothetical protein IPM71_08915 [Bacteroidota bacterium]|nr:MAG: hypothetical protein IPM71_08915 [Bacteroidota bacterium]